MIFIQILHTLHTWVLDKDDSQHNHETCVVAHSSREVKRALQSDGKMMNKGQKDIVRSSPQMKIKKLRGRHRLGDSGLTYIFESIIVLDPHGTHYMRSGN